MKDIIVKYRHIIPLLIYSAIFLIWFNTLEATVTKHYHVVHVPIDDHIPFIEVFIVPYLLWFAYVAVVLIYFFFKDREDYYKVCLFLGLGMTIFLLVSTVWPNGHHLRLTEMPRNNIFTWMIERFWEHDTSTNIVPSIHVYNSLGVHIALVKSRHFHNRKGIKFASLLLCTSIILATVFIKQHSVFDMITAFIMAIVIYAIVYQADVIAAYKAKARAKARTRAKMRKKSPRIS